MAARRLLLLGVYNGAVTVLVIAGGYCSLPPCLRTCETACVSACATADETAEALPPAYAACKARQGMWLKELRHSLSLLPSVGRGGCHCFARCSACTVQPPHPLYVGVPRRGGHCRRTIVGC